MAAIPRLLVAAAVAGGLALAGCTAGPVTSGTGVAPAPATSPSSHSPAAPSAAAHRAAAPVVVAAPKPRPTPCTKNQHAKYVYVSVAEQRMWMCARHRVAYTNPVTTGMVGQYTQTPTGTFVVQGRVRNTTLTLLSGATYAVKYWIPFQGPLFGFHDASWQTFPFGSPKYRTAGSHGCVHMPLAAIRFLYNWASVGTPVRIR